MLEDLQVVSYNHIYVARTNEDLSPYICNVCEFSVTNYCMPTRWLTGPLQKIPPMAQTSGYATECGGWNFSTRPGAELPHVGSLCDPQWSPHSPDLNPPDVCMWGYLKDRVFGNNPTLSLT